jgi:cysteinyl-tRNA synthetase
MLIYNTKSKKKEEIIPYEANRIKAYVCGPTVYDYCHIGHAKSYISFDMLKRYLISLGYEVIHIQNFTDIDDRIYEKAKKENKIPFEISERYINEYFKDMDALNIIRASKYTKSSDYITKIIELIKKLIENNYAYELEDGIYFDVEKAGGFGELISNLNDLILDKIELRGKKGPFDFILWRKDEKGFDSPFGRGFPGWHNECIVMAMDNLGDHIDIHWGGKDLIYPHHECEIIISKALIKRNFVKYWIHNGLVLYKGRKMSKSLGRMIYIRDLLKKYPPSVIRLWILSKKYREDMEFSEDELESTWKTYEKIRTTKEKIRKDNENIDDYVKDYINRFISAIDDDLNTPMAIKIIEEFIDMGKYPKGSWKLFNLFENILGIL